MLTNHPENMSTDELIRLMHDLTRELGRREEVLNCDFTVLTKDEVCSAAGRELSADDMTEVSSNFFGHLQLAMSLEEALEEAGVEE